MFLSVAFIVWIFFFLKSTMLCKGTSRGTKALLIACETKALADDIFISGLNSFIFSYLFALIWHTLGLVTFLTYAQILTLSRSLEF